MNGTAACLAVLATVAAKPAAPVHVDLAVVGSVTPIVSAALSEAARVWARYHISIHPVGQTPQHGVLVHLRIDDGPPRGTERHALGSIAFHDGMPDPVITLYPGRAWDLVCVALGGTAERWPLSYRESVLGRVLGRALAHELGHFLLQTRAHSASGLMRGTQSITDLMTADDGQFFLPAGDAAAVQASMGRRRE